ncbi:hypothetical protein Agub_g4335, partial [Astrephomene gubernaculifera]
KERILLAIRQRCGVPVYVPHSKMAVLELLGLPEQQLRDTFTTDPRVTPVHVVGWGVLGDTWPFFRPNFNNMQRIAEEMGAERVVGFCPTGWLYEMRKATFPVRARGSLSVHLVPYSEHSSYLELREYVRWLRPQQVIPTVGVAPGEEGERQRAALLRHFRTLVDETASKARFLAAMRGGGAGGGGGRHAAAAAAAAGSTAAAAAAEGPGQLPAALVVGSAEGGVQGAAATDAAAAAYRRVASAPAEVVEAAGLASGEVPESGGRSGLLTAADRGSEKRRGGGGGGLAPAASSPPAMCRAGAVPPPTTCGAPGAVCQPEAQVGAGAGGVGQGGSQRGQK